MINWGLGSQGLKHALIQQDGEQMCSLKRGPHKGKPSSLNLEALPAKAVYCAGRENKRLHMEMWERTTCFRWTDRPRGCAALPQKPIWEVGSSMTI